MVLGLDIWLLPAIAAGSSSYLVSILWERFRTATAPNGTMAGFLSALSFVMGAISAYYRAGFYSPSLESNIIVMFVAGATTTFVWLLLRHHLPGLKDRTAK